MTIPTISITSGTGYVGSTYTSTETDGQWHADGSPISGETGATFIMTLAYEGTVITYENADGASNSIKMFVFADLAEAVAEWDSRDNDNITKDGSNVVSSWVDKISGIDAAQATSGNRPVWSNTARNGTPGIDFDGSNDVLNLDTLAPLPSGTDGSTIITLAKNDVNGPMAVIAWGDLALGERRALGVQASADTITSFFYGGAYDVSTGVSWTDDSLVIETVPSGGGTVDVTHHKNGSLVATNSRSGLLAGTTAGMIGARYDASLAYWNGVIQWVGVANDALSSTDREKVEGYISHRFNRLSALPGGHPYKTDAPKTTGAAVPSGDAFGPALFTFSFDVDAPEPVSGSFTFQFNVQGGGLVDFLALYTFGYAIAPISYPVAWVKIPEIELIETLKYRTAEFESRARKRKTASLSSYPQRLISHRVPVESNDIDFTALERYVKDNAGIEVAVPDWPRARYVGTIAEDATEISGDFRAIGLSVADFIGLYDEVTEEITTVFVDEISATEINIIGTVPAIESASIVPLLVSYLTPAQEFTLQATYGVVTVNFICETFNKRKLSNIAYTGPTLDGYSILTFPIIATSDVSGSFQLGVDVMSDGKSKINVYEYAETVEEKSIRCLLKPTTIDNFYAFLDTVRGSARPFYLSTNFAALELASAPALSASTLSVTDGETASMFSAIQIETANGISYHTIEAVDGDDIDILPALGATTGDNDIRKITGLRLCHIVNDTIELEHYAQKSYASFTVRDWLA